MSRVELRLVGSGGQGMILSSVILAEARCWREARCPEPGLRPRGPGRGMQSGGADFR